MKTYTRFNNLFANKFAGCKLLGYKNNPNIEGMRLLVYKLPDGVLTEEEQAAELVGINDGTSCWIGSMNSNLKNGFVASTTRARVPLKVSRQRRKLNAH